MVPRNVTQTWATPMTNALNLAAAMIVLTALAGLVAEAPPNLPSAAEVGAFQGVEPLPDRITFYSNREGNNEIYAMNVDGSGQKNLTRHYSEDRSPSWFPDAGKITFYSNRDFNFDVYIMDADGGNQTNLTRHPNADTLPAWSPDGTKIAFFPTVRGQVTFT